VHKLHHLLPPKNVSRYNLRNSVNLLNLRCAPSIFLIPLSNQCLSDRTLARSFIENFYGGHLILLCILQIFTYELLVSGYYIIIFIVTIIDLFPHMAAILNQFNLRSIIGCPRGMSTFCLYFRVLYGTFFLKIFLE